MLDTPLVRGERVVLAEVGGVRLDMVRNKDTRTETDTSYLNPDAPHASARHRSRTQHYIQHTLADSRQQNARPFTHKAKP